MERNLDRSLEGLIWFLFDMLKNEDVSKKRLDESKDNDVENFLETSPLERINNREERQGEKDENNMKTKENKEKSTKSKQKKKEKIQQLFNESD